MTVSPSIVTTQSPGALDVARTSDPMPTILVDRFGTTPEQFWGHGAAVVVADQVRIEFRGGVVLAVRHRRTQLTCPGIASE